MASVLFSQQRVKLLGRDACINRAIWIPVHTVHPPQQDAIDVVFFFGKKGKESAIAA